MVGPVTMNKACACSDGHYAATAEKTNARKIVNATGGS